MKNSAIFSLRFGSNVKLEPSQEDLRLFLESKKEGTKEPHSADLAPYWEMLSAVAAFKTGAAAQTFREKMLCTVLDQSYFAKPALKSAVEQYKYHMQALSNLDFKKPAAFIRSAEEEIARLNSRKKEEALRIERMRGMVEERKLILDGQKKRWTDLAEELSHIISYIKENLSRIEKLCEQSIAILVNEQIDRKKETGLIEDVKTQFKERLRESLHQGTITKDDLERAKEDVAELSKRMANLIRSDIYTLTQLYETIHEHSRRILGELGAVVEAIGRRKHANYEEDRELYQQAEKILIALVSGCGFEVKAVEIAAETERDMLLVEKRREIFDHLVELLRKRL